ncbi:MAG TPA: potassium transporter TrkG [Anaerohalosphaeraceae bacterium]|mgnify:CR=1 FL=1|nr:potassium transporter TrkG [Anaerohalosphaeraceae bacterium]HOM76556.1 potassium transporter TrkG [Anaerohalosphaeraceae bacterium]HPC64681.1 potassium transporter TrkG [Anaerohalosphaeraceae bacterium]HPO70219.1 potassium transporter TrkG [Anaerohalosphaeraceae bacterium]HRS71740.1 potassium transporter TrkG [Anaerohalosphaeraceae bacterium]
MKVEYKNKKLDAVIVGLNLIGIAAVASTFVMLYGFDQPPLPSIWLHSAEIILFCFFVTEKLIRYFNAVSKRDFFRLYWFEIPLLGLLFVLFLGAEKWSSGQIFEWFVQGISIYLIVQVIDKVCRSTVYLASTGHNPARSLITLFVVLILAGAGLLMLPRAHEGTINVTDAVFTATSATCVTGLIVKNTGRDFTLFGQIVILSLMQLGGLGIVIFGAVLGLLLGQSMTMREQAALQDLLNERTLSRISTMVGFIIVSTLLVEAVGAVCLYPMWDYVPSLVAPERRWFFSIFHSISAFCNAGFSLMSNSLMDFRSCISVYAVICPLIILGGLGFAVLYNLAEVSGQRLNRLFSKKGIYPDVFNLQSPRRLTLQTKVVLTTTLLLIMAGTAGLMLFEACSTSPQRDPRFLSALFQSITARTAGFNTIDIAALSPASKLILIILMCIGGSPGSTAGGIKTVTFALVVMVIYATLGKRREVEIFRRAVPLVVLGRAVTITVLYAVMLLAGTLALTITERGESLPIEDVAFEAASAMGTVGLTTGITPVLTTAGKWIIVAMMLIGRLGPMTLLTALMFNVKPAKYDYPVEPLVVG